MFIFRSEGILIAICDCLSAVFIKCKSIDKFEILADVYSNLFHLIDSLPENHIKGILTFHFKILYSMFFFVEQKQLNLNEDVLLSAIKCLNLLISKCDSKIAPNLISKEFRPQLGHSIKVLLDIAVNKKYYILKIEALKLIKMIIEKCVSIENSEVNPSDVLSWYLPGLSISLSKIITNDDKTKKDVIFEVLSVFSKFLIVSCSDINTNQNENLNQEEFLVNRDLNWLKMTCNKLNIIFKNMNSVLLSHQNWNVRLEEFRFVKIIMTKCDSKFINLCFPVLLQVPLSLLFDENEQISKECNLFIDELSLKYSKDQTITFIDLIQEDIYNNLNSLPRLIRTLNGKEKVPAINLLYGHLKCLGSNGINSMFYSEIHRQKLFECLFDIAEFHFHGISLLEKCTIDYNENFHMKSHKSLLIKYFKNFDDFKVQKAVENCCCLISKCDHQLLFDYLIEVIRSSNLNPSVIFICNLIISNISLDSKELRELLQEYQDFISQTSFMQSCFNEIQQENRKTIKELNKEVIQTCLIIEGIAVCAKNLNENIINFYLINYLSTILQCAGSHHLIIVQSSNIALNQIANYLNYNSISSLISLNIDYLINSISIKLKYFINNFGILFMFNSIMKYCQEEMLNYFIDPIEQLLQVIDCHHDSQGFVLFQVLKTFIITLRRWKQIEQIKFESIQSLNIKQKSNLIISEFSEFIANKNILKLKSDFDDHHYNQVNNEQNLDEEETKTEVPNYIKLLENIMKRCVHLMSSYDSDVRLIVIEIVSLTLPILQSYQSKFKFIFKLQYFNF